MRAIKVTNISFGVSTHTRTQQRNKAARCRSASAARALDLFRAIDKKKGDASALGEILSQLGPSRAHSYLALGECAILDGLYISISVGCVRAPASLASQCAVRRREEMG